MRPALSDFMNTTAELHAFAIGLAEIICPWPPRHRTMSRQLQRELNREHHYYVLGRIAAVIFWIFTACLIKLIFF